MPRPLGPCAIMSSAMIQSLFCRLSLETAYSVLRSGPLKATLITSRGVGMAIRFLGSFQATVEKLNLHPDLKKLVQHPHGLILVSGPTGSSLSR